MIVMYGVLNWQGCHVDVSKTLHGAKCYATKNGHSIITKRVGYSAIKVSYKYENKWRGLPVHVLN